MQMLTKNFLERLGPTNRNECNSEIDLIRTDCGTVNWNKLARDTNQCQAFV